MSQKATGETNHGVPRRFEFARDSFAFANELLWEYHFDAASGKTIFRPREPKPTYAHRCFVLTRAARQFLYHARFDKEQALADGRTYERLVREVVIRSARRLAVPGREIVFPGYASLREFSRGHEALLKAECGGAWRSYVLRSHWRMIFPISRQHQAETADSLLEALQQNLSPIIHLVVFPSRTINHGMILFDAMEKGNEVVFQAYDPNDPEKPAQVTFDRGAKTFSLPQNSYWAGGKLDVIHIFRGWFL